MATQTLAERTATLAPTGLTPLLTTDQLMAHFGVSNWTVNEWLKTGCPVARLPGGRRRFDLAMVRDWLESLSDAAAQTSAERSRKAVAARN